MATDLTGRVDLIFGTRVPDAKVTADLSAVLRTGWPGYGNRVAFPRRRRMIAE